MIDSCGRCRKLHESTLEDAYDPRPEMHRCRECWQAEHPVAVLTLTVRYDLNDASGLELTRLLRDLPIRAAAEGLLTGATAAVVDSWEAAVEWPS